jgi:hypothetical protein
LLYVFSSTKLEIRAEQVLPGSEGGGGERERVGVRGRNDPMYAHMNKQIKQKKRSVSMAHNSNCSYSEERHGKIMV